MCNLPVPHIEQNRMKKCMRPLFKGQTYLYLPNFTKKKIYLFRPNTVVYTIILYQKTFTFVI